MKLMGGKIKNLGAHLRMQMGGGGGRVVVFNFIWTKKQLILAVLFFVFLGLASPLQLAQAGVVSGILGALMAIPTAIITLILQLVLLVTNLFVSIAGAILWWVLSPYFMSLPYTSGGIVDVGWPIVRDFINMFFIIALVIIGLATALRIKEYQVQKTLPTLIIIAILINFTPVICGLIVDASNIVMNFFLEELTGLRTMVTVFSTQGSLLVEMFSHPFDIRYAATALGKTLGLIAFGGIAGFVFLLYSILFIMRYIMIWVLVIVSPIAFFSRIFPATKRGEYAFKSILSWDEWWKQFIEWSLIGITAGFFLYLGEQLMVMAPDFIPGIYPEGVGGMLATPIIDFMNNLLPYGVVLAFLLLGYKIAKSTSAMGAQGLIKAVDTGLKVAATAAVVAATGGAAAGLAAKGLAGAARGAQRMEAFVGKVPVLGKPLALGLAKPTSWALRGIEKAAVPPLLEYQAKTRRVPEADLKKIDGMSGTEAEAYINAKTKMLPKGIAKKQRLQYQARMADKETLEFTSKDFRDEAGESANEIREKENPYYQKEATAIAKALPETVREEALVHSKLVGMPDKTLDDKAARKKKEDEIREEIRETQDIIQNRIGRENFLIEAALQLKYVTKDDIERNRAAALAEIQRRAALAPGELERAQRNIAASATFTKGLKPEDTKKMIDPDAFATRVGITLGNPRNLQRIQDNFGIKKLKAVIEGSGGLNDATNSPKKLDEFNKINPQMVNAILSSPAYRELNIEARKHMLNPNDQPTSNFDAFKRRGGIQETLAKSPPAIKSFYKLQTTAAGHQRRIEELQMRGQPTAQREKLLESTFQQIASQWPRIEKSEPLRKNWLEIEKMRNPDQARVLQRDVEAGLRIEGILNTTPDLYVFDRLHQKENEYRQRIEKARRSGKPTDYLERQHAVISKRAHNKNDQIQASDKLREKWEEVERLRRPPKEERKEERRKKP